MRKFENTKEGLVLINGNQRKVICYDNLHIEEIYLNHSDFGPQEHDVVIRWMHHYAKKTVYQIVAKENLFSNKFRNQIVRRLIARGLRPRSIESIPIIADFLTYYTREVISYSDKPFYTKSRRQLVESLINGAWNYGF
jgi:hypothetical protein